jgi:hypothetical protein
VDVHETMTRHLTRKLVCAIWLVFCSPGAWADESDPRSGEGEAEQRLIREVKELVRAGRWQAAYEKVRESGRRGGSTVGFEWNYFFSYFFRLPLIAIDSPTYSTWMSRSCSAGSIATFLNFP